MGFFRSNKFPMMPETIIKARTVIEGQWYLLLEPSPDGIVFLACNNDYKEWLWTIKPHSRLFCVFFGFYVKRLENAKIKYQKWINKKNSGYYHSEQVIGLL